MHTQNELVDLSNITIHWMFAALRGGNLSSGCVRYSESWNFITWLFLSIAFSWFYFTSTVIRSTHQLLNPSPLPFPATECVIVHDSSGREIPSYANCLNNASIIYNSNFLIWAQDTIVLWFNRCFTFHSNFRSTGIIFRWHVDVTGKVIADTPDPRSHHGLTSSDYTPSRIFFDA